MGQENGINPRFVSEVYGKPVFGNLSFFPWLFLTALLVVPRLVKTLCESTMAGWLSFARKGGCQQYGHDVAVNLRRHSDNGLSTGETATSKLISQENFPKAEFAMSASRSVLRNATKREANASLPKA
jgi:hypothetical protein